MKKEILPSFGSNNFSPDRYTLLFTHTALRKQIKEAKRAIAALKTGLMQLDYLAVHYTDSLEERKRKNEMEVSALQEFVRASIETTNGKAVDAVYLRDEVTSLAQEIAKLQLTDLEMQDELTKADRDSKLGISRAFANRVSNDFGPDVLLQLLLKWREYLKKFLSKPERIHAKKKFLALVEGVIEASSPYYTDAIKNSAPIALLPEGELMEAASNSRPERASEVVIDSLIDQFRQVLGSALSDSISPDRRRASDFDLKLIKKNPIKDDQLLIKNILINPLNESFNTKPPKSLAQSSQSDATLESEVEDMWRQLRKLEAEIESLQQEAENKKRIADDIDREDDLVIATLDQKTDGAYSRMLKMKTEVRGVSASEAEELKKKVSRNRFERDSLQHKITKARKQNMVLNRTFLTNVASVLTPNDSEALKAGWLAEVSAFFHVDSHGKTDGGKLYRELQS